MYNTQLFLVAIIIATAVNKAACQYNNALANPPSYASCDLQVSKNKTTNLVFPYNIKNVNQGSADFVSWQVPGTDNILQVKAAKDNFQETNLTVITTNGNLYSFIVNYNSNPANLTFHLASGASRVSNDNIDSMYCALKEAGQLNEDIMSTSSTLFSRRKRILFGLHDRDAVQALKLLGIYSKNDILYFHLEYKNVSGKKLETDNIHLYIREQYGNKRTVARLVEIKPISVFGSIPGAAMDDTCIIAIPKFTIPYAKYCEISVNEKAGYDGLSLKVYNDLLVSARAVPE